MGGPVALKYHLGQATLNYPPLRVPRKCYASCLSFSYWHFLLLLRLVLVRRLERLSQRGFVATFWKELATSRKTTSLTTTDTLTHQQNAGSLQTELTVPFLHPFQH